MMNNYDLLIQKLDAFIRKYYKNQLIRGGIYAAGILLSFFLILTLAEYYAWFGETFRAVLFFAYLGLTLFILFRYILIPAGHLLKIGKVISHDQAAGIIGKHFSNVQDKLLNILQLKRLSETEGVSRVLVEAGIDQKIEALKPVPFLAAIDLKANRKYLKYTLIPLTVIVFLLIASPTVIKEPTQRIVRFNTAFEKALPYRLSILNEELSVAQQEDFLLEVGVAGEELPDIVFLEVDGGRYRMVKEDNAHFQYRFRNVQKSTSFRLSTAQLRTEEYALTVLPKPIILSFDVNIDYPAYTGRKDEVVENTGDLQLPVGTILRWKFYTRDVDYIDLRIGEREKQLKLEGGNVVSDSWKVMKSEDYAIKVGNRFMVSSDSLAYRIQEIPDAFPQIAVEEYRDSLFDKRLYFRGMIKDDYGFTRLRFYTEREGIGVGGNAIEEATDLPLGGGSTQEQFFHYLDVSTLDLKEGEEIAYYFEVWDNDGVNGSKAARTQKIVYRLPTRAEFSKDYDEATQEITQDMDQMRKETRNILEEIEALRKEMLQKEDLNWQDREKIKELLDKQKQMEDRFNELLKKNEQKLQREEQYREIDENLQQKQEELQRLMEELFDEDMKKLFEELNKMMEEVDKDKVNEMMEKMKMGSEELEKELDRSLELFKQLELEKKLEETIDRMEALAEKQEELQKATEEGLEKEDDLLEEQNKLNEEFEQLREDLKDLKEKNEALEYSFDMEETGQEEKEISEDMQESSEQLQKGKKSKASEKQKDAASGMKKLSEKLQQMQQQMQQDALGEDIESLRMILENLVRVSFDQEALMEEVKEVKTTDPRYLAKMEQQKKIKDDLKMIEDSLIALSKRQVMIQSFVTKKLGEIEADLGKAIEALESRNKRESTSRQQYVMTYLNDLALMLSESMEQMQQQMQQGSGDQSCKNPNQKGQGMPSMRKMQEQLNQQMQEMKDAMEKGKKPGEKPGKSWSEQLARMAAQQEALRRQMEQYREELNKEGLGNDGDLKKMIEEMEQTETDLVNKMLTRETLLRQQEILTRMLRSEKAEQEREKEEKRESEEAKSVFLRNPEEFLEYKRIKSREIELLRTIPPALTPYYRGKVSEYFYNFDEER